MPLRFYTGIPSGFLPEFTVDKNKVNSSALQHINNNRVPLYLQRKLFEDLQKKDHQDFGDVPPSVKAWMQQN